MRPTSLHYSIPSCMEQTTGLEPAQTVWKTVMLPITSCLHGFEIAVEVYLNTCTISTVLLLSFILYWCKTIMDFNHFLIGIFPEFSQYALSLHMLIASHQFLKVSILLVDVFLLNDGDFANSQTS